MRVRGLRAGFGFGCGFGVGGWLYGAKSFRALPERIFASAAGGRPSARTALSSRSQVYGMFGKSVPYKIRSGCRRKIDGSDPAAAAKEIVKYIREEAKAL